MALVKRGLFKKNEELWHDLHKWLMTTCGSPPQCSRMALAISKPKSMVRSSETHTTGHFSWFLFAHWHLRLGIDLGARDPPCGILIMISIFPVKCWKKQNETFGRIFPPCVSSREILFKRGNHSGKNAVHLILKCTCTHFEKIQSVSFNITINLFKEDSSWKKVSFYRIRNGFRWDIF